MVNFLVNDILDLAKMESANFKLDQGYFDLS